MNQATRQGVHAQLLLGSTGAPWIRVAATVLVGSAFVAGCAHIAVPLPWTPVPMTMQPFAVLLLALLLGPTLGAATMVAYLLEGASGLPVFVPGLGGLFPLGPGAGYLLSYPLVALATGWAFSGSRSFLRAIAAACLGECVLLVCGASFLALLLRLGPTATLHLGVLPFLAGDALKILLAAALVSGWVRWRPASRSQSGRIL